MLLISAVLVVGAIGCGGGGGSSEGSKQAKPATGSTIAQNSKPKHILVADVRTCMTGHGYTFKKWAEDTKRNFFTQPPANGAYEANSGDGSVSVEYAFGEDATEAKDVAHTLGEAQVRSNVAYWWSTAAGGDGNTVKKCLSAAETTTLVLPKIGICKKPGIHYKGTTSEGVKVCFTLSPDGRKLIQDAWLFARNSASYCSGIHPGQLDVSIVSNHSTRASGQHFDDGTFSGTIRHANGSLLSTTTGEFTDGYDCPGRTFKWTAYRTP